jgi:hypothetical protein
MVNLFRVEFPAACGVASARALQDTSLLAARSFIKEEVELLGHAVRATI